MLLSFCVEWECTGNRLLLAAGNHARFRSSSSMVFAVSGKKFPHTLEILEPRSKTSLSLRRKAAPGDARSYHSQDAMDDTATPASTAAAESALIA